MLDLRTTARITLGSYVALHFATLLPWAVETFSNRGMLPDGRLSPLPSLLALADTPAVVLAVVALGALAGLALAAGIRDRVAAALAWAVSACLFARNPLIANPAMPYVGLLLVAWAASGSRTDHRAWSPAVLRALWIAMAVGYSYSGVTKLAAPSWVDGQAFAYVLSNPLARDTLLRDALLALPTWTLQALSWGALGLEITFAPLALSRRARPWLWATMLGMHVGLLVLIDFADLTAGMVVLHVCTFDPSWLGAPRRWLTRARPR
ncbi:MAG: hypothetical protein ACE37F_09275 [Nannocystaceae bacterium]|nr:hypothetical protein [bacterium]